MTDLRHALTYLFRVHPGEEVDVAAVVPRIDSGLFPEGEVTQAIADLERLRVIDPIPSGGWRTIPEPSTEDRLREALRVVVDEPDADVMTKAAQDALNQHPPEQSHAGQRRA